MSDRSTPEICIDTELTLERIEGSSCLQTVKVSASKDGLVKISSKGSIPRISLKQLRFVRLILMNFANATGYDVTVEHGDQTIAQIVGRDNRKPTLSVRWWTLLKQFLLSR